VSQVPIQQHKGNSKEPNWGKVQTQHTWMPGLLNPKVWT
jgi:hypothetical protein